jgi:hypothetical protein
MPTRKPRKLVLRSPTSKTSEILDVHMTAELLTVSPDTVYDRTGCEFCKQAEPLVVCGEIWILQRKSTFFT